METFRQAYCRKFGCPAADFERRVLWAVVFPHVRLLLAMGMYSTDHFSPDRSLIEYCGILHSIRQVGDELHDFGRLGENRRFSRRVLLLRVSGRRLQKLVTECLGDSTERNHDRDQHHAPFNGVGTEFPRGA